MIAFVRDDHLCCGRDVWVVHEDGSGVRRLTSTGSIWLPLTWDPAPRPT